MLRRGLIKKADRHTGPVSRAFFKAKRNGEARLLVDYKASQVNDMILKNFHPQFGVEQLISQIPPGMKYYFSSDVADAFFCYPLKEGKNGSDLTTFLTHTGKYSFLVSPQGLCTSQFTLGELGGAQALWTDEERIFSSMCKKRCQIRPIFTFF